MKRGGGVKGREGIAEERKGEKDDGGWGKGKGVGGE